MFYVNKSFVNSSAGSGAAAVTSQILQHHHHPILPAGNAVQCDLKKFWSPTGFQNPQQLSHAARWCFHPKLGNVASVIARASELSRPFSNSFLFTKSFKYARIEHFHKRLMLNVGAGICGPLRGGPWVFKRWRDGVEWNSVANSAKNKFFRTLFQTMSNSEKIYQTCSPYINSPN